jgi:hypothetical protein
MAEVQTTPLAIRPDAGLTLTRTQRSALERLEAFDLGRVRRRRVENEPFPSGWIDEAMLESRRFMALKLLPERALTSRARWWMRSGIPFFVL